VGADGAVDAAWENLPPVDQLREQFRSAEPWPHLVLHDVFPEALLDDVVAEISARHGAGMRSEASRRVTKRETSDIASVGPATRAAFDLLDSPAFVRFVAQVADVPDLSSDPEHLNAGVHETTVGGRSLMHVDFETHPSTGLYHVVNVLLYLNRDWQPEWGGQLELWPDDMHALGTRIEPRFNTLVIFRTHHGTPHGLPNPVACPEGRSRMSLAAYFYSGSPLPDTPRPRLRSFRARPEDSWWVGLPSPAGVVAAGGRLLHNTVARRRSR
jgi:hypothetical protein